MKKVLFTTTALVFVAGAAAADGHISFSGDAAAGYYTGDSGANGTATHNTSGVYSSVGFDIAFTGETDSGLSFGAEMNIDAGTEYDRGDFEFDGVDGGTAGLGAVWISGDFGKLSFDADGIDDLYDDDHSHDVAYSGSFSGVTVDLTADADSDASTSVSAKLGYAANGFAGSITGNEHEADGTSVAVDLAYTINENITVGLNHDMPGVGDDVTEARVALAFNNFTTTIKADTADDWSIAVGYTMDALSLAVSTDESDEWEATVSYGLGGGATVEAGVNHADAAYAGLAFTF